MKLNSRTIQQCWERRPRARKTESGSSLVEVFISVVIIAIMAGGLLGCLGYAYFELEFLRENQRASQILLEKTETIRLYRWDQVLTPGFLPSKFTDVYDPQAQQGSQGVTYNGTLAITNVPFSASYASNMVELVITLDWQSGGLSRSRNLCTYIAKDGVQNYVY